MFTGWDIYGNDDCSGGSSIARRLFGVSGMEELRLKRDIYDFTEKLDAALLAMLREEELAAEPAKRTICGEKSMNGWHVSPGCICTKMGKLRRKRRS